MIRIIAALDRRGAIGAGGDLLYRLREDMRHFRRLTTGNTVVMGRRTFESLPGGALPARRNIIVSGNGYRADGAETAASLDEALRLAAAGPGDTFIIGGGSIYAAALPLADRLDLTVIDAVHPAPDTFFPSFNPDDFTCAYLTAGDGLYFAGLDRKKTAKATATTAQ